MGRRNLLQLPQYLFLNRNHLSHQFPLKLKLLLKLREELSVRGATGSTTRASSTSPTFLKPYKRIRHRPIGNPTSVSIGIKFVSIPVLPNVVFKVDDVSNEAQELQPDVTFCGHEVFHPAQCVWVTASRHEAIAFAWFSHSKFHRPLLCLGSLVVLCRQRSELRL